MRPVIPRVRVGDILKGTRNLRSYLQAATSLNYLKDLSMGETIKKKENYHQYPSSKDEEFLVVVNAWGTFCAVHEESGLSLLFHNPRHKDPFACPPLNYSDMKGDLYMSHMKGDLYMSPAIFSQWFIRTGDKKPDVKKWPDFACYIWTCLQLNMINIKSDSAPTISIQGGSLGPFSLRNTGKGFKRELYDTLIQQWAVRGATRLSAKDRGRLPMGGCGPQLRDIESMRAEAKRLCSNPRVAQRLQRENEDLYKIILSTNE